MRTQESSAKASKMENTRNSGDWRRREKKPQFGIYATAGVGAIYPAELQGDSGFKEGGTRMMEVRSATKNSVWLKIYIENNSHIPTLFLPLHKELPIAKPRQKSELYSSRKSDKLSWEN